MLSKDDFMNRCFVVSLSDDVANRFEKLYEKICEDNFKDKENVKRDLMKIIDSMGTRNTKLVKERNVLQKAIDKRNTEIKNLKSEVNTLNIGFKSKRKELDTVHVKLAEEKQLVKVLAKSLTKLQGRENELKERLQWTTNGEFDFEKFMKVIFNGGDVSGEYHKAGDVHNMTFDVKKSREPIEHDWDVLEETHEIDPRVYEQIKTSLKNMKNGNVGKLDLDAMTKAAFSVEENEYQECTHCESMVKEVFGSNNKCTFCCEINNPDVKDELYITLSKMFNTLLEEIEDK